MFPKAVDFHKKNKPLVPNGLGVTYVLVSVIYLFLLYYFNHSGALPLASCILFGGFMGLLDDWMDLRWRYKAFLPLIAAMPLSALASELMLRTSITTFIFGDLNFGVYYYLLIIPLIVTVTTNTVNQLGGLNGLETICPLIVMVGLMIVTPNERILLYAPLTLCLILAYFNFRGKIFVGNTGSFAIGITLAAYAVMSDIKSVLLFSISPYIFNSLLKLSIYFFTKKKPELALDGDRLYATHRRSLLTIIGYKRRMTERRIVAATALLFTVSTAAAVSAWLLL